VRGGADNSQAQVRETLEEEKAAILGGRRRSQSGENSNISRLAKPSSRPCHIRMGSFSRAPQGRELHSSKTASAGSRLGRAVHEAQGSHPSADPQQRLQMPVQLTNLLTDCRLGDLIWWITTQQSAIPRRSASIRISLSLSG
jgi:hypothetical protein